MSKARSKVTELTATQKLKKGLALAKSDLLSNEANFVQRKVRNTDLTNKIKPKKLSKTEIRLAIVEDRTTNEIKMLDQDLTEVVATVNDLQTKTKADFKIVNTAVDDLLKARKDDGNFQMFTFAVAVLGAVLGLAGLVVALS